MILEVYPNQFQKSLLVDDNSTFGSKGVLADKMYDTCPLSKLVFIS
jgi:hypothetical protein